MVANYEVMIDAPLPEPPRVSLMTALREDTSAPFDTDVAKAHLMGVTFTPVVIVGGGARGAVTCGRADLAAETVPAAVNTEPFVVFYGEECSSFGFDGQPSRAARVAAGLAAVRSAQLADEFWSGGIIDDTQRVLTSTASDVVTAGAVAPDVALAMLEQAYHSAMQGVRGAIHVTMQTLTALAVNSAIRREGNMWLTASDNLVVADAGYDGTGPSPQTGVWMYATSMPMWRMSEVLVLGSQGGQYTVDALDRDINDLVLYAEQLVQIEWDEQAHFAAQTNLTAPAVGGVS